MAFGIAAVAYLYPNSRAFAAGQCALLLALVAALALLARFPLLDPVQAGVVLIYLWFGLGPVTILLAAVAKGSALAAWDEQSHGVLALPLVAVGLVLYAAAGRAALRVTSLFGPHFHFFGWGLSCFRPSTLLALGAIGLGSSFLLGILPSAGIDGLTVVNFLGGTRTEIWWVGVLVAVARVFLFAAVVAMSSLVLPTVRTTRYLPLAGLCVLAALMTQAVVSGSKGALMFPFACLCLALLHRRQRPPWALVLAAALSFLVLVEPFVMTARSVSLERNDVTNEQRIATFEEVLRGAVFGAGLSAYGGDPSLKVDRLFRGIFPVAGEALRDVDAFSGPWRGQTLLTGVQIVIPRAFFPEKPDSNVGNFFSREIGARFDPAEANDFFNSIAISLPVEVAANAGWVAGLCTFAGLGALWGLLSGSFLGPEPSRHPLSPYFVLLTMNFETSLGAFLAVLRDHMFPVAAVALVWLIQSRKL